MGTYPLPDDLRAVMPCSPEQMTFAPYLAPNIPDRGMAEAAGRLLSYSRQEGVWVGVCWTHLLADWQNDAVLLKEAQNNAAINESRRLEVYVFAALHWILVVATLGLLRLAWRYSPAWLPTDPPQGDSPSVRSDDSRVLSRGMSHLSLEELVIIVNPSRPEDPQILYPTPKLIDLILGFPSEAAP